jgi:hypothetical protein
MNGAYTEDGDEALCDVCSEALRWNPEAAYYECKSCGRVLDRALYFQLIGANPPGIDCLSQCRENYPFCKKYCLEYEIDSNDPMLT